MTFVPPPPPPLIQTFYQALLGGEEEWVGRNVIPLNFPRKEKIRKTCLILRLNFLRGSRYC